MTQITDYQALLSTQKSLQLATSSPDGNADISYAPFTLDDNRFYIYVSALAKHTANMLHSGQAGVLIIQPEAEADNIFARRRLSFNCRVQEISKGLPDYARLLELMQQRFGNIIGLLSSLPDFHLLQLSPQTGLYVAGFGKAMTVDLSLGLAAAG
ncbi:pyridoxamine 5'-phosphate oxidase family protein [Methylomonas paludis]|uniref:Pyridoxamine 5'-phosphate oxidase family protein n=1 Tax=Methylomonas paludis TaxID=1173101 RepID=A0A975R7X6_9GAMM|nr:pyridoxamine 5'-phosphate oxidase family protein [Methylomonas paludis]QWF69740.1 pyridoxamine 5'-phosphate oxidase family protein [Methylomonas paludis]